MPNLRRGVGAEILYPGSFLFEASAVWRLLRGTESQIKPLRDWAEDVGNMTTCTGVSGATEPLLSSMMCLFSWLHVVKVESCLGVHTRLPWRCPGKTHCMCPFLCTCCLLPAGWKEDFSSWSEKYPCLIDMYRAFIQCVHHTFYNRQQPSVLEVTSVYCAAGEIQPFRSHWISLERNRRC